jgi:type IV secretion system protein VirD4
MAPRVKITGEYGYQRNKKSTLKHIVRGGIGFVFVVIGTSAVVTQYMARSLNYAAALGRPYLLFGRPFYPPVKAWLWVYQLLASGSRSRLTLAWASFLVLGIFFGTAILVFSFFAGSRGTLSNVHGSARWAKEEDLINAGLLPGENTIPTEVSVYTGGWYDAARKRLRYLTQGGPEHLLVFAPTRSGKGVGLVIPSLLRWADSVLVYDLKAENFHLTSGWREKELGSLIIKLDPSDPDAFDKETSGTFNPLEELPLDYDYPDPPAQGAQNSQKKRPPMEQVDSGETAAIQNLVTMIVDPDGKGLEDHWQKTSHSLIVGCITHLLYAGKQEGKIPCLADVANEFTKPGIHWRKNIESWQTFPHLGTTEHGPVVHPVVLNAAQEMLNRDDREASSVLSTAISFLTLYQDPIIARNTSQSSFHIKDLMQIEQPVSLYLVVKPVDKDRLKPFVRLFITQVIRRLADEMKFKDGELIKNYKHRLLLMLDEFPSLGRLQVFEEAIGFIAGYGIKAYLITQDISQLHKIYGKENVISGNCHVQIAYATSNLETAKHLSEASGITTIVKEAERVSGDRGSLLKKNVSVGLQEISRPLLTVDECMRLKGPEKDAEGKILVPGDMLIFVAGHPAVYGKQMLFFLDKELSRRAKLPAPEHSGRTVEKREEPDKTRVPILGESGEPEEPSEAEMIELIMSGCVAADRIVIQDSQGREYSLNNRSKGGDLGR